MSDKDKDKNVYIRNAIGEAVRAPVEDSAQIADLGGPLQGIGRQEAVESADASRNISYVDQNWGIPGIAAEEAFRGLTLGFGPALAVRAGLMDEGHMRAAESHPVAPFAEMAGMLAPAILSGGESLAGRAALASPAGMMGLAGEAAGGLAERMAGRILGESAGIMGKVASVPIRMATQGATEGAIMNLSHQASENLVQNKPLAAEALAAVTDGALYGGLIGGGLGTFGAMGSAAVESMGKFAKSAASKGDAAVGRVQRELGISELPVERTAAKNILRQQAEILEANGSRVGDTVRGKLEASQKAISVETEIRNNALKVMEDQAPSLSPSFHRFEGRFDTEILAPASMTPEYQAISKEVGKLKQEFENVFPHEEIPPVDVPAKTEERFVAGSSSRDKYGKETSFKPSKFEQVEVEPGYQIPGMKVAVETEKPTWSKLVEFRDQFAETANTPVRQKALNILNSEIEFAMRDAGEQLGNKAVQDAAKEYAASTTKILISKEMEQNLTKRLNQTILSEGQGAIGAREVGTLGGMASIGRPVTGIGWLASKGIGKTLQEPVQRWMAQMAYENSIANAAAGATVQVRNRIAKSMESFFKTTSKAPSKAAIGAATKNTGKKAWDRTKYESEAAKVRTLISDNHLERVRMMANKIGEQGYPQLAEAMMGLNQRAVLYAMNNLPQSKGAKSMQSLRPVPASKVLDMYEHAFSRKLRGYDIFSVLDDFEDGSLSRDTVRAFSHVFPEWKNEIVTQAATKIAEMKASGEHLDLQKISTLGVLLDAPVDRILEGEYVNHVQMALNAPPANQPQAGPAPGPPASMAVDATGLLTTTQQLGIG